MNWEQKIALLLLGCLTPLIVGEFVSRAVGFSGASYITDTGTGLMILKPNAKFYWVQSCYKNLVQTNDIGFHDAAHAKNKPEGVYRIAIIGDSQVESLQVPFQNTAYKLLESKLNQLKPDGNKIEIINFGHSGNGQLLDKLYLEKYALSYHPDLVVDLFLVANDPRDDNKDLADVYAKQTGDTSVYSKPFAVLTQAGGVDYTESQNYLTSNLNQSAFRKLFDATIKKSALAAWLYNDYRTTRTNLTQKKLVTGNVKQGNPSLDSMDVDFQVVLKDYPPAWQNVWKVEEGLITDISQEVKVNGAKFLLISSADAFRVHSDELSWQQDYADKFDFDKPETLLSAIAERAQVKYLPLEQAVKAKAKAEKVKIMLPCDGHWNATTHQWVRDILFEYLKDHPDLLEH